MSIDQIINERGISEILHFTTNAGMAGVFASGVLRPRQRLSSDKYLEHVYRSNCPDRSRDAEWHDYVNLSITRINARLLGISDGKWHGDLQGWWCILSFRPAIMAHDGVVFTTTNNMYSGVVRTEGAAGLEALFGPRIHQYTQRGSVHSVTRLPRAVSSETTCPQAEVLYPGDLSVTHLQRIYVRDPEHSDAASAIISAVAGNEVEIVVDRSQFS